jgi:hypothetical protein
MAPSVVYSRCGLEARNGTEVGRRPLKVRLRTPKFVILWRKQIPKNRFNLPIAAKFSEEAANSF